MQKYRDILNTYLGLNLCSSILGIESMFEKLEKAYFRFFGGLQERGLYKP